MAKNKWVRKKPPKETWTMPDYPPQFEAGDRVTVEKHGSKVFTVKQALSEVGYRGRMYEVVFSGREFLEYEHEMSPSEH